MLFSAHLKKEIASQNVEPLILSMMDVTRRAELWWCAKLKNRTGSAAVLTFHLTGGQLCELLRSEFEAAFARVGDSNTLTSGFRLYPEQWCGVHDPERGE